MSLKLRRGVVVSRDPLAVEVAGERRAAWADPALIGACEIGDEVVVNTEALDLKLGSGGFDIVQANLTRGLDGQGAPGEHVMKLNYSPLQHAVKPVEAESGEYEFEAERSARVGAGTDPPPVLVLPLHGHLAPAAFAAASVATGLRVGFIQAGGGALPGTLSRDVSELRRRGLLCGHITAGSSYGGEREAITLQGAVDAATHLGWQRLIIGPGPGILGSATRFGHGGMAALDGAHAGLSLGHRVIISPRLSEADPRPRHRGLSHHTETVLRMILAPVTVAVPETAPAELRADIGQLTLLHGHEAKPAPADLESYGASGLPRRTMGRDLDQDRLFFAAALAAGQLLAGS